jgi:hypothetical protein
MYHFGSCAEAMQSVGSELRIDLSGHPPIEKFWNDIKNTPYEGQAWEEMHREDGKMISEAF